MNMKKLVILALVLSLCALPMLALADSTLRVQGNATIAVAPDNAVVGVGFSVEGSDSSAAQQQTADAITAIVEAVKALGIEEADIVTSSLSIYPVYNYTDVGQSLRGYRVEHSLSVTVRSLESVGLVLDTALAAGANETSGITYRSSREKDIYLQALALAIEDAAAKADAMAIATGVWLGGLDQINEVSAYGAYTRYAKADAYDAAAGSASMGSTLMTGDLEVSASVELVYETR